MSILEYQLSGKLNVALFVDGSVRKALLRLDERVARNVCGVVDHVQIRVVEHVIELAPKLQRILLAKLEALVNAGVDVPKTGTGKGVSLSHVGWVWAKLRRPG